MISVGLSSLHSTQKRRVEFTILKVRFLLLCLQLIQRGWNVYLLSFLFLSLLELLVALGGLEMSVTEEEAGKFSSNTLIEVWEVVLVVLLDDLQEKKNSTILNLIQNLYYWRPPH